MSKTITYSWKINDRQNNLVINKNNTFCLHCKRFVKISKSPNFMRLLTSTHNVQCNFCNIDINLTQCHSSHFFHSSLFFSLTVYTHCDRIWNIFYSTFPLWFRQVYSRNHASRNSHNMNQHYITITTSRVKAICIKFMATIKLGTWNCPTQILFFFSPLSYWHF